MSATIWEELTGRGAGVILGLLVGGTITGVLGYLRRRRQRRSLLAGDARDTVVIALHIVERSNDGTGVHESPGVLRIRSLGQSELCRVVPNGHLEGELMQRAFEVTNKNTLISMEGPKGSFLLETLTNFVCDRTAGGSFEHDLYIMAPCCEPAELAEHQPITIVLISVDDLQLFRNWPACREIQVEHGSDGARVLTLRELAHRHAAETTEIARLRKEGKRTRYVETMYVLDLALDKRTVEIPTMPVPWGRFEHTLKALELQ
jgi:hypothetical protein